MAGIELVVNAKNDYGNCPYLAGNQFVANYIYELPFGKGRPWLRQGALSQVVGGWSISGITTYETGPPFSVTFTPPGAYPEWVASRANVVPGVDPYFEVARSFADSHLAEPRRLHSSGGGAGGQFAARRLFRPRLLQLGREPDEEFRHQGIAPTAVPIRLFPSAASRPP